MGDFRVVNVGGTITKNGGNVASYFLTPDGHVLHAVTGPVSADVLLDEATWATDLYEGIRGQSRYRSRRPVAEAHHMAALSARNGQDRKIHELLMERPLPRLEEVYEVIFENVLGEKVSEVGPLLAEAAKQLERAKRAGRPVLFVLDEQGYSEIPRMPLQTQRLLHEFTTIRLPLKAAPALSQLTGQPPFESSGGVRPLIVVARHDGTQLASISGWHDARSLNEGLAIGWIDALASRRAGVRERTRAERLLRQVSPPGLDWGEDLKNRLREQNRKETPQELSSAYQLAVN